jgi:hypothetical protein
LPGDRTADVHECTDWRYATLLGMAFLFGKKRTAWLIGSAAVLAEVCAAVAFTLEVSGGVEELSWSLYLWAGGGVTALVAVAVSLLSMPRGSDRRPAVFALLIMAALALIFLAMASGPE